MQQPKNISKFSKDTVCFFMFLDEETEAAIKNTTIGHTKKIGLWRVVVVRNLPFTDARRNGKVPMQLAILIFLIQTCVIRNLPCCSVFFSMNWIRNTGLMLSLLSHSETLLDLTFVNANQNQQVSWVWFYHLWPLWSFPPTGSKAITSSAFSQCAIFNLDWWET